MPTTRTPIIWRLEQGAVLRANGQYEDSNKAFDTAQEKMDDYAQKAKVRLGQETGALLSNQANLDYEGRAYDGIMLNTYKALNYLALGEPDKARPELIRAYQRQQDAVADNQKRIEKVQDEAAKNKDSAAIQKAQNDPGLQAQIQNTSTNLNNLQALCRLRQSVHRLSRRVVFHDRCRRQLGFGTRPKILRARHGNGPGQPLRPAGLGHGGRLDERPAAAADDFCHF